MSETRQKVYFGTRNIEGTVRVMVGEAEKPADKEIVRAYNSKDLPIRGDVRDHSPTGFEWGYSGSGPAQLALAILIDLIGVAKAKDFYQQFKHLYVGNLDREKSWVLTEEKAFEILEQIQGFK